MEKTLCVFFGVPFDTRDSNGVQKFRQIKRSSRICNAPEGSLPLCKYLAKARDEWQSKEQRGDETGESLQNHSPPPPSQPSLLCQHVCQTCLKIAHPHFWESATSEHTRIYFGKAFDGRYYLSGGSYCTALTRTTVVMAG